jgi:anti-sigma factor RsiW
MTRSTTACPEIVLDWIAWYPEGNLPANVRSAIEVHAAECAACREEIANLVDHAPEAALGQPDDRAERVFAAAEERIRLRPQRSVPAPRRRLWIVRPGYAVAAGLALALFSGAAGIVASTHAHSEGLYETATAAPPASEGSAGPRLDVVFRSDASFAEVSRAIQRSRR